MIELQLELSEGRQFDSGREHYTFIASLFASPSLITPVLQSEFAEAVAIMHMSIQSLAQIYPFVNPFTLAL